MPDQIDREIAEALAARRTYFTPAWFARLFGARLGMGDTFWIGHFGTQIALVPLGVAVALAVMLAAPSAMTTALFVIVALEAALHLAVSQAVLRVALGTRGLLGWRIAAVLFSLALCAMLVLWTSLLLVAIRA